MTSTLKPTHKGDSWSVFNVNCIELMQTLEKGSVDLVATDPPWGIDWPGYDTYDDSVKDAEYINWCKQWMAEVYRLLKPNGSFWLAISEEFVSELDVLAKSLGFHKRRQITQYSTFGVACSKNFSRCSSFWLYYTKHRTKFTFNFKDSHFRVPSSRQLVYKDKRANKDGKLPDSVFVLHPDDLAESFDAMCDTWLASRVAGTFKERVFRGNYEDGVRTCPQMPSIVMDRIVRASSNVGDLILDPFGGTFATGASAVRLHRQFIGCDISKAYCNKAKDRLSIAELDRPAFEEEDVKVSIG